MTGLKTQAKTIHVPTTTMVIIFCGLLMFYQIFFLPQAKWSMVISSNNGIYEFSKKLPNNLRLMILGN